MDFSNIFRLVNLAVGGIMILGGISQFIPHIGFRNIIVGIYVIIFGLVYIFVGCIILENNVLRIIAGTIIGFVGVGYCALEFLPSIEPPSNMRDADAGWGAEQV
ncbi:hypothetical protein LTR67_000384 [Exophiala xenobiotica]|nr:hypothetical protein LTR92_000457 [Exophiala xenobiotica]KAK5224586.1 hypothetical protein LTR72_004367 [Exophiala xenobiotica]KAK5243050.1 hypothetical protein LTS06_011104 [Exophiala xenobiotica]KAK5260148.1 hypothetical protein LTR40_004670 [Exophiala xenobiotica]KAK5274580.1 hypothetical protein LTR96_001181 [Exophiala xenobiotica]